MLRLCPTRAFMAFACLCTTRLSVGRSRDGRSFVSRFPTAVAVAAALVTDGVPFSLSAAWGGVFTFWISTVSSRDSVIFDLQISHIVKPIDYDRCQWRETE